MQEVTNDTARTLILALLHTIYTYEPTNVDAAANRIVGELTKITHCPFRMLKAIELMNEIASEAVKELNGEAVSRFQNSKADLNFD